MTGPPANSATESRAPRRMSLRRAQPTVGPDLPLNLVHEAAPGMQIVGASVTFAQNPLLDVLRRGPVADHSPWRL